MQKKIWNPHEPIQNIRKKFMFRVYRIKKKNHTQTIINDTIMFQTKILDDDRETGMGGRRTHVYDTQTDEKVIREV